VESSPLRKLQYKVLPRDTKVQSCKFPSFPLGTYILGFTYTTLGSSILHKIDKSKACYFTVSSLPLHKDFFSAWEKGIKGRNARNKKQGRARDREVWVRPKIAPHKIQGAEMRKNIRKL
jgi:hypothetical protein